MAEPPPDLGATFTVALNTPDAPGGGFAASGGDRIGDGFAATGGVAGNAPTRGYGNPTSG
jgi:hypothetical protein